MSAEGGGLEVTADLTMRDGSVLTNGGWRWETRRRFVPGRNREQQ